jgi:hypothetical protein
LGFAGDVFFFFFFEIFGTNKNFLKEIKAHVRAIALSSQTLRLAYQAQQGLA